MGYCSRVLPWLVNAWRPTEQAIPGAQLNRVPLETQGAGHGYSAMNVLKKIRARLRDPLAIKHSIDQNMALAIHEIAVIVQGMNNQSQLFNAKFETLIEGMNYQSQLLNGKFDALIEGMDYQSELLNGKFNALIEGMNNQSGLLNGKFEAIIESMNNQSELSNSKFEAHIEGMNNQSGLLNSKFESLIEGTNNQSGLLNRKFDAVIDGLSNQSQLLRSQLFDERFKNFDESLKKMALLDSLHVEKWLPVRSVSPIASYPAQSTAITYDSLLEWSSSEQFQREYAYFHDYPTNSLMGGKVKVLIYHLLRTMRPEVVVEVGTYFAGTSEIIARALWENGTGMLHTADPYGDYCYPLIERLPSELQRHIAFYKMNSMEFFDALAQQKLCVDLALVDGCHDYQHAYFDVVSAAKLMRPGGLVMIDNVEDVGPYWAGYEFLKLNPAWTELGSSMKKFSPSNPFDTSRSLLDTNIAILQAPVDFVLNDRPISTGNHPYQGAYVSGVKFNVSGAAPRGRLHIELALRGFADGVEPQTRKLTKIIELDGHSAYVLKLESPIRTSVDSSLPNFRQLVEIGLFWQPLGHSSSLHLLGAPEPFE
jgi:predicted O-methyltransferase YrrM/uncharacterized protein YoxC